MRGEHPAGAALSNPARFSAALAALFPAAVEAAELRQAVGPELLTPAEWQSIRHCREPRVGDFTAGRLCARRALQRLGVWEFSLLPAADRQACWPPGIVGSITHTQGYGAAVVAHTRGARALGVDSVLIEEVTSRLWPRICTEEELDSLHALRQERQPQRAALIFAAKEAFFKCQFAVTREWLDFRAVGIQLDANAQERGCFRVVPQRGIQLQSQLAMDSRQRLRGRYRRHGRFITAGLALPPVIGT